MCEKDNKNNIPETSDNSSWQDDIEKRGYYYDDSTGYEVYTEEDDREEESEERSGEITS